MNLDVVGQAKKKLVESFIEIEVKDDDDFLKIKETLTRMGIVNKEKKKVWQSCHILHKAGKYYLVHFLQLFALDGRTVDMNSEDYARLYSIANLIENWGLTKILNREYSFNPDIVPISVGVIPYKDRESYQFIQKYHIGKN